MSVLAFKLIRNQSLIDLILIFYCKPFHDFILSSILYPQTSGIKSFLYSISLDIFFVHYHISSKKPCFSNVQGHNSNSRRINPVTIQIIGSLSVDWTYGGFIERPTFNVWRKNNPQFVSHFEIFWFHVDSTGSTEPKL